ncbi:PA2169 family four-helix-bundle protein [Aquincola sp. S2]|uniref:PA2169 family four-helix-bundle protein n=1 Tax=Pseudaquabacterium terrae TaxID=2732868 RepID=A0ABX2EHY8_9BURK|nr:PA2169 family four-helix-bundle protein [Aquabacterium terrae]NRF68197.1 PA2169 family four-helix-bundle protein [Aquabacterium terrae]
MDNDDVIDVLNDLIETSKDGEYGFRTSAEYARTDALRTLLLARADECKQAIDELQVHVTRFGGKPQQSGSIGGALHRGWVAMRTKLTDFDNEAILEECERGEDLAVNRYRKALQEDLPEDVRALVLRQSEGVKRNHDQIKRLRDEARAAS